jgi:hypothetical protein
MTGKFGVLAVVMLVACGSAQRDADTLAESIRSFNDGIRWGRYEVAAAKIPTRERSQFIDEMDSRGDDVRISEYEIVNVDAHGTKEARVHLKFSWYRDKEEIVRETHSLQTWERHGKDWFMVQEARTRGAAMPGLPEGDHGTPDAP